VLINAYWSPFARRERFPVPDHPIIKWLGEERTERYFPQAIPRVFNHFAAPLNAARQKYGLPPVGSLLEVLTHGDYTLYPDDPELTPVEGAPLNHRFLGPVLWQPDESELGPIDADSPPASGSTAHCDAVVSDVPLVYVTLGSSGQLDVLPSVLSALAELPVRAVVATAGRVQLRDLPPNVVARPFVRGAELAARSHLVVSNGGSTTGYQALAQGTPVLGLPSNFDQYLATEAIVRAGAGEVVKARQATTQSIKAALARMLRDGGGMREAARRIAERFATHHAEATFGAWVAEAIEHGPSASRAVKSRSSGA
jgi:UDP:flavonoid glycosyltransferase YjiC (YdhE family)